MDLAKKDAEIKQSEEYIDRLANTLRAVRQDGHHAEISDLLEQMATKDARIKGLEQRLEGQKAYSRRLEAAYRKAEFWNLWHTGKYDDVGRANKKAEEALEKLRKS
jgi:hypothetical protein